MVNPGVICSWCVCEGVRAPSLAEWLPLPMCLPESPGQPRPWAWWKIAHCCNWDFYFSLGYHNPKNHSEQQKYGFSKKWGPSQVRRVSWDTSTEQCPHSTLLNLSDQNTCQEQLREKRPTLTQFQKRHSVMVQRPKRVVQVMVTRVCNEVHTVADRKPRTTRGKTESPKAHPEWPTSMT